jgi:hypothetical protein
MSVEKIFESETGARAKARLKRRRAVGQPGGELAASERHQPKGGPHGRMSETGRLENIFRVSRIFSGIPGNNSIASGFCFDLSGARRLLE